MEGRVDLHGAGKLEGVGHRIDPANHLERPDEAGRQFAILHPQRKISSGEPDPLAGPEGDQPPVPIGLLLVLLGSLQ